MQFSGIKQRVLIGMAGSYCTTGNIRMYNISCEYMFRKFILLISCTYISFSHMELISEDVQDKIAVHVNHKKEN